MMSNLVAFNKAGLPALAAIATAIKTVASPASSAGSVILKMDKTGHWVFGADQTEVEADSKWAVNPFSFVHGWIAWGDGVVLGEKMVALTDPLPEMDGAPPNSARGWEKQVGFSLKCLTGEDKGLEARYTATSVGGKRGFEALASAFANQVSQDESKPVPVVLLKKEHYQHKSYGRIYTPVFEIVEFVSMDGPVEEEEEAPAPTRRRRAG
ncbi:MAG: hypothetical protein EBT04_09215 [Betaproteobacteria bacterium]|nr:hypothetical protein [Betaproteobacteria bacterium]